MIVGVPKSSYPGERRVALVPPVLASLTKVGLEIVVERGAGVESGWSDATYEEKGARLVASRAEVFQTADVVAEVRAMGANPDGSGADLALLRKGQIVVSLVEPLAAPEALEAAAGRGVSVLAMELIPRTTRAQSMDALSSMATVSGYLAVLRAATRLPKFFPMFMTAAGTISPAKVFVIGAGVAGLQACSTAKRLGAVVSAYDTRPVVKEQVESVGARFIELALEVGDAQDQGGYAKAQGEEFYRRQRELMGEVIKDMDVVITTAAVPGKKSPVLVTKEMVEAMRHGSVIVDLAAEKGGNCELTRVGEVVDHGGVLVDGPRNLPADLPVHASQMYAKNVATLLAHLTKEGKVGLDLEDEITRGTVAVHDGKVVHPAVLGALGKTPEGT